MPSPSAAQEDPFFDIDGLNAGLGEPPEGFDRATPRAAMEGFLRAAEVQEWEVAAHALDLSDIAPDRQPRVGAKLAMQLHAVIERRALLDWP